MRTFSEKMHPATASLSDQRNHQVNKQVNRDLPDSRYNEYHGDGEIPMRNQTEDLWKAPPSAFQEAAYLAVLRTADGFQAAVADLLKPYGLSSTQYNALRILRGSGEDGLACSRIAERMIHRDPDITRLLDRLEAHGLISRSRGREDRRKIFAHITRAGLLLLKKLDPPVQDFIRRLFGKLEESRVRSAIEVLEELRKNAKATT
jgi:DNA-binding MarR family transcriptional regulator